MEVAIRAQTLGLFVKHGLQLGIAQGLAKHSTVYRYDSDHLMYHYTKDKKYL